jgi:hypothetical protein
MDTQIDREPTRSNPDKPRHDTETRTIDTGSSPPRTTRSGALALVVLCAGMLMIVLDQTIVNVALPSIRRDLGFTQSGLA